ncbi:hypothetical protein DLAC_00129 [Tieghemostelium lacteum]|uniref:Transmembrane protein n=1 Tax=Tieghemostelium lacteum TaxID=361077 RepID=A0A152A8X1_TIELA|nr:hypothetical protein DLAC_00129 [Tieghemostelium lacteum]|eukprot:KYR02673.1 hypothetical protein DLAC_00129 [Tieghemostelium lacteum]
MQKTIDFLENCDLNPKYQEEKQGRNPISGIITILYFPLLLLFLFYNIQPQYTPLPSCCVCANFNTPTDSWVYLSQDANCRKNTTCREMIQSQLKSNCDAALQYRVLPDMNVTVNLQDIGCVGLTPGSTCDSNCLQVSDRWATNLDFTFPDNEYQSKIRCPLTVGACDFKATYSTAETVPHAVCRYPELGKIVNIIGTSLGLLNGMLITFRVMLRTFWSRIGQHSDRNGHFWDYFLGLGIGIVFNYFAIMYMTLAPGINKRMRYGTQLAIGLSILFIASPFVVYLIIIFNSFWTPMAILIMLTIVALAIVIRTVYNLLKLEIHSRNCVVLSQGSMDMWEIDEQIVYKPPERLKPVPNSKWVDFFEGFYLNILALYPLKVKGSYKRYTGLKSGFYCSLAITMISLIWGLMFGLDGWSNITYNFPFVPKQLEILHPTIPTGSSESSRETSSTDPDGSSVDTTGSYNEPAIQKETTKEMLKIAVLQSVYFIISWSIIMVIIYHLSLFLKYLPEKKSFLIPRYFKKPLGTKLDYRFGFIISMVPLFLTYFFFFYYEFIPFVTVDLPLTPSQCQFPGWTLIIPILGVIPSLLLLIMAHTERFRWGVISAVGVSFLLFGIGTEKLLFYYCIGLAQNRYYPLSWFVSLLGTFIIVYSSIRPDTIFVLDRKNDLPTNLQEERLLSSHSNLSNVIFNEDELLQESSSSSSTNILPKSRI